MVVRVYVVVEGAEVVDFGTFSFVKDTLCSDWRLDSNWADRLSVSEQDSSPGSTAPDWPGRKLTTGSFVSVPKS